MKNLKFKLAVAALVLGVGSAFATLKHYDPTDRKWSKDPATGVYTDITGQSKGFDYDCDSSDAICTETYPLGVDPNHNTNNVQPLSQETGMLQ